MSVYEASQLLPSCIGKNGRYRTRLRTATSDSARALSHSLTPDIYRENDSSLAAKISRAKHRQSNLRQGWDSGDHAHCLGLTPNCNRRRKESARGYAVTAQEPEPDAQDALQTGAGNGRRLIETRCGRCSRSYGSRSQPCAISPPSLSRSVRRPIRGWPFWMKRSSYRLAEFRDACESV